MRQLNQNRSTPESLNSREGLSILFDQHYRAVFGFCFARTGSEAAADDVASETFMQAARWFADGRGDRVDRQWLFVTARSRMVDRWRQSGRERNRFRRLTAMVSSDANSEAIGFDPSTRQRVRDVLASLPERQCAALALRYLDEMSVSEVADAMDVSYRTAESLLGRGRRGFIAAWEVHDELA